MDAAAIQALIDAKEGIGGVVELPAGTHTLQALAGAVSLSIPSGVTLKGAGRDVTTLRLDDGEDAHCINVLDASDVTIEDLSIDGNRTAQTAGTHGIRGEGVTRLTIQRVNVRRARGYNIGLQGGIITTFRGYDLLLEDSGSDGFDSKNLEDANSDNQLHNCTVNGLDGLQAGQKAGIDFRGPWIASGLTVTGVTSGFGSGASAGIRFRQGELLDPSGLGAHGSSISAFSVTGDAGAIGVSVVARSITARNGTCTGMLRGVDIMEDGFVGEDIATTDCITGYLFRDAGSPYFGNNARLRRCSTSGATNGFWIDDRSGTVLEQCTGDRVRIGALAATTMIVGPSITILDEGGGYTQHVNTTAELITALTSAGFTPLSAHLGADSAQRVLCKAVFSGREGQGTMWHEIAAGAALSTAATPMAAAYNALR